MSSSLVKKSNLNLLDNYFVKKKIHTLYYINIFFTITQHIYKIMFFSITGRLLPGADDVELLDVFVPEHGGGQPGL